MHTIEGFILAAAAAMAVPLAHAQQFPNGPVRIVVAQPPGGTVDTTARVLATDLAARWKQPVVVENKPGAGGNIGSEFVAKSAPDGHTLMISPAAQHTINPWLYSNLPVDLMKGFSPVALIGSTPMVLAVRPSLPARSLNEFITLARDKPGSIRYSSAGNGTYNHLAGESIAIAAQAQLAHIPYKGVAPAITDVVGGHVDATIGTVPSVKSFIANGTLRPIAVTTAARSKALPDVPTLAEAGLPGVEVAVRILVMAPADTPSATVQRISRDVEAALKTSQVSEALEKQGIDIDYAPPAKAQEVLHAESASWSATIKQARIKLD